MKIVIIIVLLLGVLFIGFSYLRSKQVAVDGIVYMPIETPLATSRPEFESFNATFEVYTNGTKRIFSDPKYFSRSSDVFINADNPKVITVKKDGITWGNFFDTLPSPMKVTKDCLTTGTGQVFCTNELKTLKFWLNDKDTPDALDQEVASNDHLKVIYE